VEVCGRFTLSTPADLVAEALEVPAPCAFEARYNVAPTQVAPVVRQPREGARRMHMLRWGLVPSWARDARIGSRMINARAESVLERPAFREAFRRRRCLVPADGFFEWQPRGGGKHPFLVRLRGGGVFAMAGLWARWRSPDGEPLDSFTVLTTTPNEVVAPLHDRMPVILPPERYAPWLDPTLEAPALTALLAPFPASAMERFEVSRAVNDARRDEPVCIAPVHG